TILPVSNVIVPTEVIVAERTLYLPSWGAMLGVAALGASVQWPRWAKPWLLVLALVAGAGRSVARLPVWRDDQSFFAAQQRDAAVPPRRERGGQRRGGAREGATLPGSTRRPSGGALPGLDVLLFQQLQELLRCGELREPVRHVRLLRELGDLAEDGEILIRDLERRGDDEEEVVDRPVVDGLEVDPVELAAEG